MEKEEKAKFNHEMCAEDKPLQPAGICWINHS